MTIPEIKLEELQTAAAEMKAGKAPGPDGVPAEMLKLGAAHAPQFLLKELNKWWKTTTFPEKHKVARAILIKKPGKENIEDPSTYRPICLLNNTGKLLERLIRGRLVKEIEEKGGFSDNQYGFIKGRSTIEACNQVVKIAEKEKNKSVKTRGMCVVVALDVKNAFNTASWEVILKRLKEMAISPHLANCISQYLEDRKILLSNGETVDMTCGVPQGSVLGPTLWNVLYDEVLRLELSQNCTLTAYADDLALTITARTTAALERNANEAINKIDMWMNANHLALAKHKTEAIMIAGRKKFIKPILKIGKETIKMVPTLKYLGVTIDPFLNFGPHVEQLAKKATKTCSALYRLMPNLNGPTEGKRKVYAGVVTSVITYAITVWRGALKIQKYRKMLAAIQRRTAIRVLRAYKTTRHDTALALAGIVPIEELAEERIKTYGKDRGAKTAERKKTLARWEEKWRRKPGGEYTKEQLPDLVAWNTRKHGEMSFHLTQALTGHGCFGSYLERIRKSDSQCWFCDQIDTPSHTIQHCQRWNKERQQAKRVATRLFTEPMAKTMLDSEKNWMAVNHLITEIMTQKEQEGQKRQARRPTL